jgi:hypothetical protein
VDWIIILNIHICRQEATFQRPEEVWFGESSRRGRAGNLRWR